MQGDPFSAKSVRALRDYIETQLESVLPALVRHEDSDRAIATSKTLRTLARLCGDWYGGNGKNIIIDAINQTALLGYYEGENIYLNKNQSASSIIIQALNNNEIYI